ncbi:MAG: hypothetical protein ABIH11_05580 [Candidatus Altiarchaeota archaeon]
MKEKDNESRGLDSLIPRESKGEKLGRGEIQKVLSILDELLGRLPDEEVEEFAKSKEYELYVKLLESYNVR